MRKYLLGSHFLNVVLKRQLQLLRHRLRAATPVRAMRRITRKHRAFRPIHRAVRDCAEWLATHHSRAAGHHDCADGLLTTQLRQPVSMRLAVGGHLASTCADRCCREHSATTVNADQARRYFGETVVIASDGTAEVELDAQAECTGSLLHRNRPPQLLQPLY